MSINRTALTLTAEAHIGRLWGGRRRPNLARAGFEGGCSSSTTLYTLRPGFEESEMYAPHEIGDSRATCTQKRENNNTTARVIISFLIHSVADTSWRLHGGDPHPAARPSAFAEEAFQVAFPDLAVRLTSVF